MKELGVNEKFPFLVIGHRGCAGIEPENTLRSVRRAIDIGCEMVEVDVYLVDGRLVVHHDETVNRTSDGVGLLEGYSFEGLRELDFGEGEKIPTLDEVLDVSRGSVAVNVELKGEHTARPVVEVLRRRQGVDRVVLSSFDWQQLREVRASGDAEIAVLLGEASKFQEALREAEYLNAAWVNIAIDCLSQSMVAEAHRAGLKVASYTVKSASDLGEVVEKGADACFADDPKMVIASLCDM